MDHWVQRLLNAPGLEIRRASTVECEQCGAVLLYFDLTLGDGSTLDGLVCDGVMTVGRHCSMDDWDNQAFCDDCVRQAFGIDDAQLPCVEST